MASALETIRTFSGQPDEDITSWIKEVTLVQRLLNLPDDTTLKAAALRFRNTAQKWHSELIVKEKNLDLKTFFIKCSDRFCNTQAVHETLEKFLAHKTATTREEYKKILNMATFLLEKGCLSQKPMVKLLIGRSPSELKVLLLQAVTNCDSDWYEFIKIIEENMWIAFPENTLQTMTQNVLPIHYKKPYKKTYDSQSRNNNRHQSATQTEQKRCLLHGKCGHTTSDCDKIKELNKQGIYLETRKTIRAIEEAENDSSENVQECNKNNINYSLVNNSTSINQLDLQKNNNITHNFFKKPAYIFNKKIQVLIDTGAQKSLFNKTDIPINIQILPISQNIKLISATGNKIPIIGQINNEKIRLCGNEYLLNAYVTTGIPQLNILGEDFLRKHPEILKKNIT
ncbi:hypothetical protein BDAP_001857 [Binucleata daphniae]